MRGERGRESGERVAVAEGGVEEENDEAAEDPGGDGDFGRADHGGAFEENGTHDAEGKTEGA